jgi:hypothetical protein
MSEVARLVACCEDPHWVSTVVAAVPSGSPAAYNLPDFVRVDPDSVKNALLDIGQQLSRVEGSQTTITAADGGTEGINDYNICHGVILGGSTNLSAWGVGELLQSFWLRLWVWGLFQWKQALKPRIRQLNRRRLCVQHPANWWVQSRFHEGRLSTSDQIFSLA